jgi:hypothetical protein
MRKKHFKWVEILDNYYATTAMFCSQNTTMSVAQIRAFYEKPLRFGDRRDTLVLGRNSENRIL